MNVVLEEQSDPCEVILHVEVPSGRVDGERESILKEFGRQARLPGYRPGKAPRGLVESKFGKEIQEELTNRLLRRTLDEAIREKGLQALRVSKLEKADLGADGTFRYSATVVTNPKFELPDYQRIEVQIPEPKVGEEDVDRAMENLREPHAGYDPVEGRPLQMGDFAVLTYRTHLGETPLKEAVPAAPPLLQGRDNFWIEMRPDSFLPGFCDHLLGLEPGAKKSFSVGLPDGFAVEELRGKSLGFEVEMHSIHTKSLPEWNDELAARIAPGKTLEELRGLARENLERIEKEHFESRKRGAAMSALLEKSSFPLPRQFVHSEMNAVLRDIVLENQGRGVGEEELRKHEDEILGAARQSAEQRVRGRFLLLQIAEREKLEVGEQELLTRIMELAARHQIPVKKLVKDLQRRDAIGSLREQILAGKALDLIASKVVVVPPAP